METKMTKLELIKKIDKITKIIDSLVQQTEDEILIQIKNDLKKAKTTKEKRFIAEALEERV